MLLAKTNVNLSYFSLPRLSLFFEKLSEGTHHPYAHYFYTFLFDTDDEFLFSLLCYDYKAISFEKKTLVTLSLEQCLEILKDVIQEPHHKNFNFIVDTVMKDGIVIPGLYRQGGDWYVKKI